MAYPIQSNHNSTTEICHTLLALITPALIGEILGSLAKLRPVEKRPAEKGSKKFAKNSIFDEYFIFAKFQ